MPAGSWYADAVQCAVGQRITDGTSETTFSPGDSCTCGQIMTFLWRAAGRPVPGAPTALTASWAESYYKTPVTWGDRTGMLLGTGGFLPEAACTRAQTVTWLQRGLSGQEMRTVSDAAELLEAIGSHRTVFLKPGTYDLTGWIEEATRYDGPGNPAIALEEVFDGWEIRVKNVEDLTLCALDPSQKTELTVSPRYADVLGFDGCDRIALRGLTLGHTPEPGECVGAVLEFRDCGSVSLSALELYGCGTWGVCTESVESLLLEGSRIYDCSYGLLALSRTADALAVGCDLETRYDGLAALDISESRAEFLGCRFTGNDREESSFLYADEASRVTFTDCDLDQGARQELADQPYLGSGVTVTGS